MRLRVAFLALTVACTAVPAPGTATIEMPTTTPTTLPAPTTTTTTAPYQWEADPDFTIRVGVSAFPDFDPILSERTATESGPYGIPQQPSLYRLVPPTATLIPLLAADPEPPLGQASDDGWEIVVNLRQGVTWDDGTTVDAEDVAFSFQAFRGTPKWQSPGTPLRAVEVVDESTVRLVWEERPTIEEWQLGIALAPIVSADFWEAPPQRTIVPTTGPYRLAEVDTNGWSLEAVPNWWEAGSTFTVWGNGAVRYINPTVGRDETYGEPEGNPVAEWTAGPYASRVEYIVFGDMGEALPALDKSEIDLVFNGAGRRPGLQSLLIVADFEEVVSFGATLYWIAFNTLRPPFDDLEARLVAACGVDPVHLATQTLEGGVIATTSWGTGLGPWNADAAPGCDKVQTNDILEGQPVPSAWLGPGWDPFSASTRLWVEAWLYDLGAEPFGRPSTEARSPEWFFETLADPDQWTFAVMTTPIDTLRLVIDPERIAEVTGWEPPGVRLLIERARATHNLETARGALKRLQEFWAEEVPGVPFFSRSFVEYLEADTITPPFLTPDGDRFTTPLLGGLQAWESWVIPATQPAP